MSINTLCKNDLIIEELKVCLGIVDGGITAITADAPISVETIDNEATISLPIAGTWSATNNVVKSTSATELEWGTDAGGIITSVAGSVPIAVSTVDGEATVSISIAGEFIEGTNDYVKGLTATGLYWGTSGVSNTNSFADFYATMPDDNSATVAVGDPVEFPQTGEAFGTDIVRLTSSTFKLVSVGWYQVSFQVSITEAGQLMLAINGAGLSTSRVGRTTETSQIYGTTIVKTTEVDSILSLINPVGNLTALTITPNAGGVGAVSAHLVIVRLN